MFFLTFIYFEDVLPDISVEVVPQSKIVVVFRVKRPPHIFANTGDHVGEYVVILVTCSLATGHLHLFFFFFFIFIYFFCLFSLNYWQLDNDVPWARDTDFTSSMNK